MADNLELNAGSGGATLATAEVTFSGDTVDVQIIGTGFVSGSAESYAVALASAGAGAVGTGVQRVTLANDDPAVIDLAAIEILITSGNAILTTIDADTGAIKTSVELIDDVVATIASAVPSKANAISGTDGTNARMLRTDADGHLQIDVLTAPTTAVTGTFWQATQPVSNAGTFIVQVDGAALTSLQLIDDAVYADDDPFTLTTSKVMAAGAVRDDSLSALAAAEGDVVPLRVGSTGALHVTGAGGGTQHNIDDAAGATDTGTLALVIRDDSLTTLTPADGDYVGLRVNSTGALHVTGGGGGTEYTEDVATPNPIVGTATLMERDDALATLTPAEGDWVGLRSTSKGALWVGVDGTVIVDGSGVTQPVSGTVTANAGTGFASIAVVGGGAEATALRVTLANDSTGLLTVDTAGTSGLEVVQVTAGDLNMTEASASAIKTAVELIDDTVVVLGTATYSEATTKGSIVGVVRNDVLAPLANTNNEIAPLQVDELGALWTITAHSLVDDGNSTTTPLGIGANFTGTGVDTLGTAGISVQLFADEDGAANGMRFEFSTDNTNWDNSHRHDYIANTGRVFQFTATSRYFRVVFINGSTGQSAIRIQTVLHHDTIPSTTIHRLDDSLAPDRSAQVVKASLMAQAAGSGNFVPINSTAAGNLKVAVEEFDATLEVTNGGTFVVQEDGAALTALQLLDNTVAILGTATYTETATSGNVVGAVRNDDLGPLADTDNEIGPLQTNSEGALYTTAVASETKRASGVAAGGTPGTDDIVGAVAARKIRILALGLFATSATANSVFLDNVDNDLLFNTANPLALALDADGDNVAGFVLPFNPGGWFETDTVNEAVTLNSSAAQDIAWTITYIEVP